MSTCVRCRDADPRSRRIRLTFQVATPVQTRSLRPSSLTTQTGVDASVPSFLYVVSRMYFSPASAARRSASVVIAEEPSSAGPD